MHRSASTTRASEEFHLGMVAAGTPPSAGGKGASPGGGLPESGLLLPKYDPQSDLAKKEAARARSAEGAVHLIPLLLIACAVVLWFFSSPQIDVTSKGDDSMLARIENMTIEGYSNDTKSSPLGDARAADRAEYRRGIKWKNNVVVEQIKKPDQLDKIPSSAVTS